MRGAELVLVSGGLDSTVCLALATETAQRRGLPPPLALSFDYGQRHRIELTHAGEIAKRLGAQRLVVELDAGAWGGSALTDPAIPVPAAAARRAIRRDPRGPGAGFDPDQADSEIPVTYVPARNLIFLSIALGVAEARNLDSVAIGINAIDYSGYPDCRPEFLAAFQAVARLAQRRAVQGNPIAVVAPLLHLAKPEIIALGTSLGAPLELSWSCYLGGDAPCGTCDSCRIRAAGFAAAGIADPALVRRGEAWPPESPTDGEQGSR